MIPQKAAADRAFISGVYFRKTNHSLAAKFRSEHIAMARRLAT
jgi:hypothetical protein